LYFRGKNFHHHRRYHFLFFSDIYWGEETEEKETQKNHQANRKEEENRVVTYCGNPKGRDEIKRKTKTSTNGFFSYDERNFFFLKNSATYTANSFVLLSIIFHQTAFVSSSFQQWIYDRVSRIFADEKYTSKYKFTLVAGNRRYEVHGEA